MGGSLSANVKPNKHTLLWLEGAQAYTKCSGMY